MITYLLFPVRLFLLFYSVVLSFIFKERSSGSLIWLWGILGTVILFLLVDYLTTITLLSRIPYFSDALLWLIPIYYFFTLSQSYRAFASKDDTLKAESQALSWGRIGIAFLLTFFQFIVQMAVLIIPLSFWGFYMAFGTTDYQVNTFDLRQEAPSFFTEESKLKYPSDAELIHSSYRKWGANSSRDIVFRVDDIESFRQQAFAEHDFIETVMDFPDIGNSTLGESFGNILLPPFCMGLSSVTVNPRYFKVTREVAEIKNFCGERYVFYSQIDRWAELGIIMVILPKERLVWLNYTGWF